MKRMDAAMSRIGTALLGAVCITHFQLRGEGNPAPVVLVDWALNLSPFQTIDL
jgi:hypothetical protein